MIHRSTVRVSAVAGTILCTAAIGNAVAQDTASKTTPAAGGLDEVIVTAQRRAERIQDVPLSVSVLSGDDLNARGVSAVQSLPEVTPGLLINDQSSFQQIYIRGIGSDYGQAGVNQSVATYVDGVIIQSAIGVNQELTDIARVEVLKGPQGTLYGRNGTGGAINVITRNPSDTPRFDASVGAGNYGSQKVTAYLSGPLTDKLAASVAGIYKEHDSYLDNIGGPSFEDARVYGGRGKLQYTWDSGARATLSVFSMKNYDGSQSAFVQLQPNSVGTAFGGENTNKFFAVSADYAPKDYFRQSGAALRLDIPLAIADLVSISGWMDFKSPAGADFDATTADLAWFFSVLRDRSFTQEFQLTSSTDGPFTWLGGVSLMKWEAGYEPLETPDGLGGTVSYDSTSSINSYAAYLQGRYALSDALGVTVGGRFSYDDMKFDGFTQAGVRSGKQTDSSDNFSPSIGVDLKTGSSLIYATLRSGYKGGSYNLSNRADVGPVDPEKVYGLEIGIKSEISPRARIEASVFGYKYKDIQISFIPSNTDPTRLENANEARIIGMELLAVLAPVQGLQVTAGASWLPEAEYTDYENGTEYIDNGVVFPPFPFGYSVAPADFSDNRMVRAPKISANVGLDYLWSLSAGSLRASSNVYYTSSYYFSAQNAGFARQDSYTTLNAGLTYLTPDEHWSISVSGNNLTDEEYYGTILPNTIGIVGTYPAPRTYMFSVGYRL